jgi:hypothetical protein
MTAIKYFVAACVLALYVGTAKAAIVDFRLDGGVIGSSSSSFFGTVNIDTTTGAIGDFFLLLAPREDELSENQELVLFQSGNSFGFNLFNREFLGFLFGLTVTLEGDLIGYMGGDFVADFDTRGAGTFTFEGTVTKVSMPNPPSEVPLPAALPLFLTALAALGCWEWRRRRASV